MMQGCAKPGCPATLPLRSSAGRVSLSPSQNSMIFHKSNNFIQRLKRVSFSTVSTVKWIGYAWLALNFFNSSQILANLVKPLGVGLGKEVACAVGHGNELTPLCLVRGQDDWSTANWFGAGDVFAPLPQESQQVALLSFVPLGGVVPTSKNAPAESTANNSGAESQMRDGYEWWVYVWAFLCAVIMNVFGGILAVKSYEKGRYGH